ncbi:MULTISPECIES: IclR family transcriptional regulator [unclassified Streptomyces]|uniref:IclR family transcriptional regulator n=1 Tax=unclassified Streptomyces TaxID=2593676 RepID=UPI001370A44A|nr:MULTISPECIES: IclR family transcriptional regulator C-terminal domain-containing protein [unclassified Streptomyces]MCW5251294.1 helix-turn-helix domain-containing protein [Streptomyces sp. SHP 1-2]MYU22652.1 helix-turn-helix domain-containing protein [Streptomyces sp. SID8352]
MIGPSGSSTEFGWNTSMEEPAGPDGRHRKVSPVSSVLKATRILHSFNAVTPCQSLRQIATRTGIPRTTAHGLCVALVQAEMLEPVPGRGYRLGPAFIGLGGQVIERVGLLDAAKDVGKRFVRFGQVEAHLAQLVGGWIVYLDRTSSLWSLPTDVHMGSRVLAHTTDCGRAALAALAPEEAWRRVAVACEAEYRPVPERQALETDLAEVRRRGFATAPVQRSGRASVGAAITNRAAVPVGGVSISAPVDAMRRREVSDELVKDLLLVATTIGRRLPHLME